MVVSVRTGCDEGQCEDWVWWLSVSGLDVMVVSVMVVSVRTGCDGQCEGWV